MEKTIALIRTRLYNRGITGVSNDEIRKTISNYSTTGDLTKGQKDAVVQDLLTVYMPGEVVENTSEEILTVKISDEIATPESQQKEDIDFTALFHEKQENINSLVVNEAKQMNLAFSDETISLISSKVQLLPKFQENQLYYIRQAIIAFVDHQSQERDNQLQEMITNVTQYSNQKTNEFNNNMMGELSTFFRQQEECIDNNTTKLLEAINSYK